MLKISSSFLISEDSQVTSTISPLQSPHKGLPPRPPSHNRPPPPQSLEGLRQMHYHRNDYDKSPIKPKMWSESSLDEPYEKVKKRSSHSHSRWVEKSTLVVFIKKNIYKQKKIQIQAYTLHPWGIGSCCYHGYQKPWLVANPTCLSQFLPCCTNDLCLITACLCCLLSLISSVLLQILTGRGLGGWK